MDFYEKFIEYDYNPFVLFNKNGKIKSVNQEAQYLLGAVSATELYHLALSYASGSYGFKTTFLNLEYGRYKFFAVCVGYENDEEIGIRLYRYPELKLESIEECDADFVNIYALIDLCISANATKSKVGFKKEIDPTLPEIKLNAERFIKLLTQAFERFSSSKEITIKLHINIGEYIKIADRKFTLFAIEIIGDSFDRYDLAQIKELAKSINSYIEIDSDRLIINIPMITS